MEDLQSYDIRSVSMMGILYLDEEQQLGNVLEKHQDGWPETPIDKLGFYEVDGVRHHVGLDIVMMGESERVLFEMEAHVFSREEDYESAIRLEQERQYDDIQSILEDLGEIQARGNVSSNITWVFRPDSRTPIISLPMLTVQGHDLPFSEISGVHLKRESGEGTIHIIMDLQANHALWVTISFPQRRTELSDGLLKSTIQEGNQVIQDFVFESGLNSEDEEGSI